MTEQQAQDANANGEAQDATPTDQTEGRAQDASTNDFDSLPDWAKQEIETLRKRGANYRTRAKENEGAVQRLKELEDAEKTEIERVTGERDSLMSEVETLRNELRDGRAESAFVEAASRATARSPKTLFRAFKSDLTFDDDGNATNIDAVIDALKENEPDLFRLPEGDGGRGRITNSGDDNDMNNLFRKMRDENTRK